MTGESPIRVLIWQWGRFGGAPRFAAHLAAGFAELPGVTVSLSLATGAEIMRSAAPPRCDLPVDTYATLVGWLGRFLEIPFAAPKLARRIAFLRPDLAICAQTGPLDLLMARALALSRVPFAVIVHDADPHPGDRFPLQIRLQQSLCHRARAVAALTAHVGDRLVEQSCAGTPDRPLIRLRHPPILYDFAHRPERTPGPFRLLSFGRLLPYKGLDLLAESLALLGARPSLEVRIVGSGPETSELNALRRLPGVRVENRWVPEAEVGALFDWADAVVLPYREASQSGVAAVALASGRRVVATRVGGLTEQLCDEPLAILCEPDAAGLATGLRRALEEPLAAVSARTATSRHDDWREMACALLRPFGVIRAASAVRGD